MSVEFVDYFLSPFGLIGIFANEYYVTEIGIVSSKEKPKRVNKLTEVAKVQLAEYFDGQRTSFSIPIKLPDFTPFCKAIYQALVKIPFGAVITYQKLAHLSGSPRAYRAAGSCIGKNPFMIIVPCHRVLASNGKIGGFAFGTDVKRGLLQLEGMIS